MLTADYARWFRGSTPYISAHRNKTFVVLIPGEALAHVNLTNIVHDLALLHVLGVRLVIVHGARPQIDAALPASDFHSTRRITDADGMHIIAGVHGQIRAQIEGLFSTGLPNSPLHNVDVPVVTGNYITAKPIGVIDGVDHLLTGAVRRVERERVRRTLDAGAVLLQSPIGYSPSGQAFNLPAEELAADIAIQVGADKLVVFNTTKITDNGTRVSTLTPASFSAAIGDFADGERARLASLQRAVRGGVTKAHLVSHDDDGALLAELFTAEGIGTQVVEQASRAVRVAATTDVAGIVEVIRPLEESGALVRRDRDRLEQEIDHFLVAELDGIVVGCCAVYRYDAQAELACVAVHENYRKQGGESIGQRLLAAAEDAARAGGASELFALTTQARDWFAEQGFHDSDLDSLPPEKQSLYNWQRNSVVVRKAL